jgi:hypothetical protein
MCQVRSSIPRYLVLLLLLATSFFCQAQPTSNRHSLLHEIAQDANAESELRRILGKRYARFEHNLEVAANPVRLRDGGIFLDGWRADHPDAHAAALVLYEDGRVYVAYVDRVGTRTISWIGGTDPWRHPALQIWLQRFQEPGVERTGPLPRSEPASGDAPLSYADQEALRKVAVSIWGRTAVTWEMNVAVGNLLVIVTDEILQCSAAIGFVPKPTGSLPGWSYVTKNALQIANHVAGISRDRRYRICVVSAARNWRSAVHLASMGLWHPRT